MSLTGSSPPHAAPPPSGTPSDAAAGLGAWLRWAWPIVGLAAWTLYVWITRIANASADDGLSAATRAVAIGVSAVLVVLALVVLAALVRHRRSPAVGPVRGAVRALASATVAVWVVRGTQILLADYGDAAPGSAAATNPVGFKAVHLVLGGVSVVLAVLAWRAADRAPAGGFAGREARR